ncbi:MAG: hypothetical protein HC859_09140, partial [Bacteroidia bacterium]|nr:hypothetical protein [Bacteroidia bacterium]
MRSENRNPAAAFAGPVCGVLLFEPVDDARAELVELGEQLAAQLGVRDNDLVRVSSSAGELTAPAVIHPGTRPDVVAIPTGQGHTDYGRFAAGRGSNLIGLLTA